MPTRLLILGFGNPGRGDDGLGPALIEALEKQSLDCPAELTLSASMQLQPEQILDIQAHDLILLADAGWQTPAPFAFTQVRPLPDHSITSHALSPQCLLAIYQQTLGPPPPVFLLTVRGERFGLGDGFSPRAQRHLAGGLEFIVRLVQRPVTEAWQRETSKFSVPSP